MRVTRLVIAFAILGMAGTAFGSSPIPSNNVDDFGLAAVDASSAGPTPARVASIPNCVDDFGVAAVEASSADPTPARVASIPNYVDDFGPLAPTPEVGPSLIAEVQSLLHASR